MSNTYNAKDMIINNNWIDYNLVRSYSDQSTFYNTCPLMEDLGESVKTYTKCYKIFENSEGLLFSIGVYYDKVNDILYTPKHVYNNWYSKLLLGYTINSSLIKVYMSEYPIWYSVLTTDDDLMVIIYNNCMGIKGLLQDQTYNIFYSQQTLDYLKSLVIYKNSGTYVTNKIENVNLHELQYSLNKLSNTVPYDSNILYPDFSNYIIEYMSVMNADITNIISLGKGILTTAYGADNNTICPYFFNISRDDQTNQTFNDLDDTSQILYHSYLALEYIYNYKQNEQKAALLSINNDLSINYDFTGNMIQWVIPRMISHYNDNDDNKQYGIINKYNQYTDFSIFNVNNIGKIEKVGSGVCLNSLLFLDSIYDNIEVYFTYNDTTYITKKVLLNEMCINPDVSDKQWGNFDKFDVTNRNFKLDNTHAYLITTAIDSTIFQNDGQWVDNMEYDDVSSRYQGTSIFQVSTNKNKYLVKDNMDYNGILLTQEMDLSDLSNSFCIVEFNVNFPCDETIRDVAFWLLNQDTSAGMTKTQLDTTSNVGYQCLSSKNGNKDRFFDYTYTGTHKNINTQNNIKLIQNYDTQLLIYDNTCFKCLHKDITSYVKYFGFDVHGDVKVSDLSIYRVGYNYDNTLIFQDDFTDSTISNRYWGCDLSYYYINNKKPIINFEDSGIMISESLNGLNLNDNTLIIYVDYCFINSASSGVLSTYLLSSDTSGSTVDSIISNGSIGSIIIGRNTTGNTFFGTEIGYFGYDYWGYANSGTYGHYEQGQVNHPPTDCTYHTMKIVATDNTQQLYFDNSLYITTNTSLTTLVEYIGFTTSGKVEISNIILSKISDGSETILVVEEPFDNTISPDQQGIDLTNFQRFSEYISIAGEIDWYSLGENTEYGVIISQELNNTSLDNIIIIEFDVCFIQTDYYVYSGNYYYTPNMYCHLLNNSVYNGMTKTQIDNTGTIGLIKFSTSKYLDKIFNTTVSDFVKEPQRQYSIKFVISNELQMLYVDNTVILVSNYVIDDIIKYIGIGMSGKNIMKNYNISISENSNDNSSITILSDDLTDSTSMYNYQGIDQSNYYIVDYNYNHNTYNYKTYTSASSNSPLIYITPEIGLIDFNDSAMVIEFDWQSNGYDISSQVSCYLLNDSVYDGMDKSDILIYGNIGSFWFYNIVQSQYYTGEQYSFNSYADNHQLKRILDVGGVFFNQTSSAFHTISYGDVHYYISGGPVWGDFTANSYLDLYNTNGLNLFPQRHIKIYVYKGYQVLRIDGTTCSTSTYDLSCPVNFVGFSMCGLTKIKNISISKRDKTEIGLVTGSYYSDFTIPTFDFSRDMLVLEYKYKFDSSVDSSNSKIYTYLMDNSFNESMSDNDLSIMLKNNQYPHQLIDGTSILSFFDNTTKIVKPKNINYSLKAIISQKKQFLYIDNTLCSTSNADLTTFLKFVGFDLSTKNGSLCISSFKITKYTSSQMSISLDYVLNEFFNMFSDISTDKIRELLYNMSDYSTVFYDTTYYSPIILLTSDKRDEIMSSALKYVYTPVFTSWLSKLIDTTISLNTYENNICVVDQSSYINLTYSSTKELKYLTKIMDLNYKYNIVSLDSHVFNPKLLDDLDTMISTVATYSSGSTINGSDSSIVRSASNNNILNTNENETFLISEELIDLFHDVVKPEDISTVKYQSTPNNVIVIEKDSTKPSINDLDISFVENNILQYVPIDIEKNNYVTISYQGLLLLDDIVDTDYFDLTNIYIQRDLTSNVQTCKLRLYKYDDQSASRNIKFQFVDGNEIILAKTIKYEFGLGFELVSSDNIGDTEMMRIIYIVLNEDHREDNVYLERLIQNEDKLKLIFKKLTEESIILRSVVGYTNTESIVSTTDSTI